MVRELPQCLEQHLQKHSNSFKDVEKALKNAFIAVDKSLSRYNVNIEATGSTGTVAIVSEHAIHVANVGE